MNRAPVAPFKSGPIWQNNVAYEDAEPTTQWLFLQENLERKHGVFVLPNQGNTVMGTVLKVGPEATSVGISVGDAVVYEEWMGGRWIFQSKDGTQIPTLIISVDNIHVILKDE